MNEITRKYNKTKKIFIGNKQITEILNDINDCREESNGETEPECMLIVGDSGSGKTTIIDKYLADNPRVESQTGTTVPILFTTLPPNATPITASEKLLSDLGDPLAFQKGRNHVELTKKIITLLRTCQVELIIIDEFQHMIDRKQKEVLHSAADWLKVLIIGSRVPVILFGMPYSTVILDTNSQLKGRFQLQHKLKPFRVKNEADLATYKTFLELLDEALPFPELSKLNTPELMHRIYFFSQGNLRYIRKLINRSTKYALTDGSNFININHFQRAAPKVNPDACKELDPFDAPLSELILVEPSNDVGWENYYKAEEMEYGIQDKAKSASKNLQQSIN